MSRGALLAVGPLPPPVNGLSKAFSLVVAGLPRFGWSVRIVDIADRGPLRVGSTFSWARAKAIAVGLVRVAVQTPRADVVYFTIAQSRLGFAKDLLAIRWALALGRPVVVHMHGGNFGGFYASLTAVERLAVKRTLDRLSAIIVLTESLKADFDMTDGWQQRTVAVANTCDVALGRPRWARAGSLRILYLSALLVSKGYREAVLAAGALARRRPDLQVSIDLAGGLAPERDFPSVEAQAEDLRRLVAGLPGNVTATVHGAVDTAAKEALLAGADVFVLPTRYPNEGQPIAIIEALTSGLPVIATDWRGIRETLPPAMHGLLVANSEPDALADKLATVAADGALLEKLSRAALAWAPAFGADEHLRAIDEIMTAARERTRGPAASR